MGLSRISTGKFVSSQQSAGAEDREIVIWAILLQFIWLLSGVWET